MTTTYLVGDVLDRLATLPDASVDCVVTSPPYYGLRDYGTGTWDGGDAGCNHKHNTQHQKQGATSQRAGRSNIEEQRNENYRFTCGKCGARRIDQQIGLEPTPTAYLEAMVGVFREVRRVLAGHGTCWLNMGDGYAGGATAGPARPGAGRADGIVDVRAQRNRNGIGSIEGSKPKDLLGMPWRLALSLQADGWWLRSDIIWAKPNPMPESVTDRPTKSHEYVFLLTKAPRYYYDADAVRNGSRDVTVGTGRNKRTVWTITTQPYPEAHFATYPEKLAEPCVLAGCPERVCTTCGVPSVRVVKRSSISREKLPPEHPDHRPRRYDDGKAGDPRGPCAGQRLSHVETLGWTDCGHDTWRPGIVLDPFAGSGVTALVAESLGRDSIYIDLKPEYAELARKRIAAGRRRP